MMRRSWRSLSEMPLQQWPRKVSSVAWRTMREHGEERMARLRSRRRSVTGSPEMADAFADRLECGFFISVQQKTQVIEALAQAAPDAAALVLRDADAVCAHTFDLLGSGPQALGQSIDWHMDFKSGRRWDTRQYFKRIRPAVYPGGYDIKTPWELSRCQHFVRLGQAYWITGDERYATEFATQIADWLERNPHPFGVNWACAMDVAIRAVNWLWALALLADAKAVTAELRCAVLGSLEQHGRHIFTNLEREGDFTNNHYLADIVGLAFLGLLLPSAAAETWRAFALRELEQQMLQQVYEDGVDFEASLSYHRLAAELFLAATILAFRHNHTFSADYMRRLERMLEFVKAYSRSDGTAPQIGDNDNGRLHRLAAWGDAAAEWVDHRYLLSIGAVLFERADLGSAAGDQWQEAVWIWGADALPIWRKSAAAEPHKPASTAFPIGGIYIMRGTDLCLVLDAGANGQRGAGGHAHNDVLSFDFFARGQSWIVDPGTCAYTFDYEARNRYRATAAHNAVKIDDAEINRFDRLELFRLRTEAAVDVHRWVTQPDFDFFDAEHWGYRNSGLSVSHRRQVYLAKAANAVVVCDTVSGAGRHRLSWRFTFAPQVGVRATENNAYQLEANSAVQQLILVQVPEDSSVEVESGWYSPGYGVQQETARLHYDVAATLPFQQEFVLMPGTELSWRALESIRQQAYKHRSYIGGDV